MPVVNMSMSDDMYSLVRRMQSGWGLGVSATMSKIVNLFWAHWSGCLGEEDADPVS